MRRAWFLVIIVLGVCVGIVGAQNAPETPMFTPFRQIGQIRPQGIQYDPNFDRFVWVDVQGRLLLVDAATVQLQHVIYEQGAYNAYRFSHDGRWLAIALDRRIELWDTQTGERVALFEPNGANLVQGPIHFTPDDRYLLLDTVVPAPQETRRSENDTSIIPWLWDLEAARGERSSRYTTAEDGYAFFEYRNGLVVGANTVLIGGIPNRLMVIDGSGRNFPVVGEISADRFERDPITVWESATDSMLYADPETGGGIVQVNTETGALVNLPIGNDVTYRSIQNISSMQLADMSRVICPGAGITEMPLLHLIYGDGYTQYQNDQPITYMLFDMLSPLTMGQERGGLLMYALNEQRGVGTLDLIRPPSIQQMILSPDHTRLMVRRADGQQPIELYNLQTCTLDLSITPAEPDGGGDHVLAFNADGSVIVSDFQRFDAASGAELAHVVEYTRPFDRFTFSTDSASIAAVRGYEWQRWELETVRPVETRSLSDGASGEILAQTNDGMRLLRRTSDNTDAVEIVDLRQGTRRTMEIPGIDGRGVTQIIPNSTWESMLVVYSGSPEAAAVYTFGDGLRLFATDDDLPLSNGNAYGWLNDRVIYITGYPTSGARINRIYGVDYDPATGLPACLVQAFPNDYSLWLQVWEVISLNRDGLSLNRLTQRLCAALPDRAADVIPALTPTATFSYRSRPTPLPYAIPDVPVCITERFPFEATRYAAIWREISAGATGDQLAELETMICEGLIGSVGSIRPTPTINPNLNVAATSTPVDAAPVTTGGGEQNQLDVIAIDIETGQRSHGDYIPPHGDSNYGEIQALAALQDAYRRQFNRSAGNLILSPDGWLAGERDGYGFITVYRLGRNFNELAAQQEAAATQAAQSNRSIGLDPTATAPFEAVGDIRPTLTPTATIPAPTLVASTPVGWVGDGETSTAICPSRTLYTLDNPPPDYAATGRILAESYQHGGDSVWIIEPDSGRTYGDPSVPEPSSDSVVYSMAGDWIARYEGGGVIVSRPDGSQAVTVVPPGLPDQPSFNLVWEPNGTLYLQYQGYVTGYENPVTLRYPVDLHTGQLGEPILPLDLTHPVEIGDLPILSVDSQPGGMLAVVTTPVVGGGTKYWLYNRETGEAQYFAQNLLRAEWHSFGWYLYYGDEERLYRYNVETGEHALMPGALLFSFESPSGEYRAYTADYPDENVARIAQGDLPLKVYVWNAINGEIRSYCIPGTGRQAPSSLIWSPNERYLAFVMNLPIEGDYFPTPGPTAVPYTPQPTQTDVPLEEQYQSRFPHILILDTQTGYVTDLGQQASYLFAWVDTTGGEE